MSWLGRLLGRRRLERELDRELQFHLDQHIRDLIALGFSPAEANRRARIELGGVEQVKEEARDVRGTRWLEDWWQDTRYAFRAMGKAKAFTAAAVATLAIGIGANTAVFNVLRALLLRPLPVERPRELSFLERAGLGDPDRRFSGPDLERFRAAAPDSVRIAAMSATVRMYATLGDQPELVLTQLVSGDWFSVLGVRPAVGRLFGPDDNRTLGGHPVAILSHEFWARRFGQRPDVVGQTIRINGVALVVVGVTEAGFQGIEVGAQTDAWAPLVMQSDFRYQQNASMNDADSDKPWLPQEGIRWLGLVVRNPAGRSLDLVRARLEPVFRGRIETALAGSDSATRAYALREHLALAPGARGLSPLRENFADPLVLLMATVGLVLLIACANLASLLLARSAARSHEIAIRMSLGARGGRLVRQVLTESVTLALLGGAASLVVGFWGGRALLRLASGTATAVPLALPFDWGLLGFVVLVSLVTGLGFGLAPAARMRRTDLYDTFKTGGRVAGDGRGQGWSAGRLLVVTQVGLSLTLLVVATVFVRSLRHLLAVDPGYDRTSVIAARIDVRSAGYLPDQLPALYQRLLDGVRAVPGVTTASLSIYGVATGSARTSSVEVPGKVRGPEWDNSVQVNLVTEDFFATLGVKLVRGRAFSRADGPGAPRVAVVTESMARKFFETDNPIGLRFGYDRDQIFEVVGVARDVRPNSLRAEPTPMMFLPLAQEMGSVYSLEARVVGSPAAVGEGIRRAIGGVDRNLPVREVVTVAELLERGVLRERMVSDLTGVFGLLAALLAAIGLHGVMSYSVARRTNELGVRLALGASPGQLRALVLRDTLAIVAAGLAVGAVLLLPVLGLIKSQVYGMSPRDPAAIGVAAAILLGVGVLSAAVPAWRASRVDPVEALRRD